LPTLYLLGEGNETRTELCTAQLIVERHIVWFVRLDGSFRMIDGARRSRVQRKHPELGAIREKAPGGYRTPLRIALRATLKGEVKRDHRARPESPYN
jgi:hypothetical protein